MSSIPSKNTEPEMILRRALWQKKLRYRVHYKQLPGKPDVVFTKYRIAVFCDGDFWHGHNWAIRGLSSLEEELAGYSVFWRNKIEHNIVRDREVDRLLTEQGWTVIRLWESEIRNNLDDCVNRIADELIASKAYNQK